MRDAESREPMEPERDDRSTPAVRAAMREERLRALATMSSEVVYRASANWSDLLELYAPGFLPELEQSSRSWSLDAVHPDDRDAVAETIRDAIRGRTPIDLEHRVRGPDGGYVWTQSRAVPILDDNGEILEWIGTARDVSGYYQAQCVLAGSAARDAFRIELADVLRRLEGPVQIVRAASQALCEHLDVSRVQYMEFVDDGAAMDVVADHCREGVPPAPRRYDASRLDASIRDALERGKTVVWPDVSQVPGTSEDTRAEYERLAIRSYVVVPRLRGGRLVAAMSVHDDAPRAWSNDVIALVEEVAERTGAAVDRVRADEALREGEAKYRSLFNAIDEAFTLAEIVTDDRGEAVDYRLLEMNPAFERMTGIPRDRALGRTGRELVPNLEPQWVERYAQVALDGTPVRFVDRVAGLDRWFDVYAFPRGEGVFATVFRDITEQRRSEEALRELTESLEARVEEGTREVREKEERFRRLVEASASTVWTADRDGCVVEDSPSWRAFTGQSEAEWLGTGWLDAVHPEDRDTARRNWERSVATGEIQDVEMRLYHAESDTYRWISVRAVPLRDDRGEVRGWIGMDTDIDERKRAEERVRELASRLTVAEHDERRRIARILHDDLQQMLHGVEIKLASVARHVRSIDRGDLAAEIDDARRWILKGVHTTRELSVDLSPFILQRESFADALAWLRRQMRDLHGLEVQVDAEQPFPIVDEELRVLLFQVVRELLFNVKKHAAVEHALVELIAREGRLVIQVSDEGRGFDLERVVSSEDTRTGFGLFSIRERLALVGGRLEIEAGKGRGTRVTVVTPVDAEDPRSFPNGSKHGRTS